MDLQSQEHCTKLELSVQVSAVFADDCGLWRTVLRCSAAVRAAQPAQVPLGTLRVQ